MADEIDVVDQAGTGSESAVGLSATATIRDEGEVLVAEAVPGNEATPGEVDLAVSASAVAAEAAYDPAGHKGSSAGMAFEGFVHPVDEGLPNCCQH